MVEASQYQNKYQHGFRGPEGMDKKIRDIKDVGHQLALHLSNGRDDLFGSSRAAF